MAVFDDVILVWMSEDGVISMKFCMTFNRSIKPAMIKHEAARCLKIRITFKFYLNPYSERFISHLNRSTVEA